MPEKGEETGVSVNNQEVIRDSKGRFVKGTPTANPGGRPKSSGFRDRLNELVGEDSRELAIKLAEIAFYEFKRGRWPKYTVKEQLKALELILKYKEPEPPKELHIEQKSLVIAAKLPADMEIEDLN